jgi:hypothetical protein
MKMTTSHEEIRERLSSPITEAEFRDLRCPTCGEKLLLRAHPKGTFFICCNASSEHLAMHGENPSPPRWWEEFTSTLGWY